MADDKLEIKQYTAQYFASQLINLDWVKHGSRRSPFVSRIDGSV